ncbi:dicarboxylate/amino acid:cation symporter [Peptoniphilus sp. AGMB00490]|uniref:Dicarboxylate/amino acid:cation symporter n=1 Tax=Peptoniphilus faecalis TaxID=2731255 RepID=A0A848RKL8_9FIRM|nr:dicarboxylate/amino acid:cation symporter [Peptoniphilus faecalis]NMW85716.1 dicarboxylate/amino acid:cation symporter [Peptoniphilus faecalis]
MKKIWSVYGSSLILLFSMVFGGVIGYFVGPEIKFLQPFADIFLNLLYVSVVPLIFFSLTTSIAKMTDMSKLKKILVYFIIGVFITGICACLSMVLPMMFIDPIGNAEISLTQNDIELNASFNVLSMFTVNDFPLLFSKNNLMALIVFSVILSFSLIRSGDRGKNIIALFDDATEMISQFISIVMKIAPIGLGSYFAILIGENGSNLIGPMAKAILIYSIVVVIYYIISQTLYAYIGAGSEGVKAWWKTGITPTLTALGTCSSAATLPSNLNQAKQLGIPDEIADLVVPLGANLHKDGACIIQILKVAFLCSLFDVNFVTVENIFLSILVAVIASIVMGGIPAGGYVAEIFIISAFGFPQSAIPIMVLIGTITDAPATVINVTGDTGLAMVIARLVDGKDWFSRNYDNNKL